MGDNFYWEDDPSENVFMEITDRGDLGADVKAPIAGRGGVTTGSYRLVPLVRPGCIVVHYRSDDRTIVVRELPRLVLALGWHSRSEPVPRQATFTPLPARRGYRGEVETNCDFAQESVPRLVGISSTSSVNLPNARGGQQ